MGELIAMGEACGGRPWRSTRCLLAGPLLPSFFRLSQGAVIQVRCANVWRIDVPGNMSGFGILLGVKLEKDATSDHLFLQPQFCRPSSNFSFSASAA